ncbi:MAG: pilus (MSHA type) biogenesis protein MshL [Desulfuromonadales bacterium C00003107]|nr:MAG: pilus (MSHA type) biogenesis protein MshL [Desulfuromonadales bacterium C00003107]
MMHHLYGSLWRSGLLLVLIFLAACAQPPRVTQPLSDFEQHLEQPTVTSVPPELPPEVAQALLPKLETEAALVPTVVQEPRFDVAAQKIPAREFFMGLVTGTPYNMVVQPGIEGQISLTLKNVTIPEVMEVLRDVYGYYYRQTSTGFQVMRGELQTQLFHVNYLNLVRKGSSQTRVSSGQVSDYDGDDDDNSGSNNRDNRDRSVVSGSQVGTESVNDFWTELATALRTMVGQEEGRRVIIQPQASVVVVRALPPELRQVADYLTAIQGNLQRQVTLEAKILEVELSDGFQSGINWALFVGGDVVLSQTGGGTIFGDAGVSDTAGNSGILSPLNPTKMVEGSTASAFGGVFSAALSFNNFAAFIELLETQGDVQVLSSPRIATVNNQKAVIKVGSDEFFVTDISSTTVTGTATTTSPDITLTPFFSGIALDVTPQIDAGGRVTLHVHPTISQVTDQQKTITVSGQVQTLPLAFSTVRESDSIVSAQSGQVVVIGGLMKNLSTKKSAGIPLLGQLPGVGSLFRHSQVGTRKSELVILLRPMVVDDGTWETALQESSDSFEQLGSRLNKEWRGGLFARPVQ